MFPVFTLTTDRVRLPSLLFPVASFSNDAPSSALSRPCAVADGTPSKSSCDEMKSASRMQHSNKCHASLQLGSKNQTMEMFARVLYRVLLEL